MGVKGVRYKKYFWKLVSNSTFWKLFLYSSENKNKNPTTN